MVVSGNKPSPVALYQNHAIIVFTENNLIKCQISTLNLNVPRFKWGGVEEPTINNSFKTADR